MVGCSVLVARIVCNALGGRRILKHPGQLVGNFKIGVGIQMTIGSKGCLYFFMPQTLFDQQGILAHADEQGGMGMSQGMDFDAVYAGQFRKFFQCPWKGMLACGYAVVALYIAAVFQHFLLDFLPCLQFPYSISVNVNGADARLRFRFHGFEIVH